jgi:small redox-active disulfide protein 2
MKIEILGPGCPRCHETHRNILNAAAELGLDADIQYITDIAEIAARGIMQTPVVMINGKVVTVGKVPNPRQAKDLLLEYKDK